jgi:hypothetical protein
MVFFRKLLRKKHAGYRIDTRHAYVFAQYLSWDESTIRELWSIFAQALCFSHLA